MDIDLSAPHSMGTTIIGVTYNGGVVLGADSRTSTGMYVANRASDKITQLTDNVYICRSGSAADSQVISDYVRYFLHQHTIQLGQPATVKVAANLVRLLSYQNKNMLQMGVIVGGWDKYEGGQIYSVPLGGTILKQPFAIGGSGSTYLYGFFDQAWKEGMSKDEAEVCKMLIFVPDICSVNMFWQKILFLCYHTITSQIMSYVLSRWQLL
ncbi:hypothetical protein BHE74_00055508 [Ensete ventricosum]|uniref:Proteasome subunit beta n=1 Tax=Ensete ventricosum TaxID=4639 RepID=A0A426Y5N2_ENSVE|nr:hypothetical protein B296_00045583 [Ensete ventricosum]RWW39178.1 hypothetical protein BHE74_00055508 [Ensete ventricosum]